jgi:hypothetical protein
MRDACVRAAALGGIAGPATFVGGWIAGAATTDRPYSSISDAISRLAAVGADSRSVTTAGFIGFGSGRPSTRGSSRRRSRSPAARSRRAVMFRDLERVVL